MEGNELERNNVALTLGEYLWYRDRARMLEELKERIENTCRDELGRLTSWRVADSVADILGIDEEKKEMPTVE